MTMMRFSDLRFTKNKISHWGSIGVGLNWGRGSIGPGAQLGWGSIGAGLNWAGAQLGWGSIGPGLNWVRGSNGPGAQLSLSPFRVSWDLCVTHYIIMN